MDCINVFMQVFDRSGGNLEFLGRVFLLWEYVLMSYFDTSNIKTDTHYN